MIVTSIAEYRKNSKYKVFLNDEFAFVLYKGELRRYDISVGKDISEDVLEEIYEKVLLKRAKLRAMNLLQTRDYTEQAMRTKLKEGLYPLHVIDRALDYVKSFHYIDDYRYAESYITYHSQGMSRRELEGKLRLKGISDEVIERAICQYEDEYGNQDAVVLTDLMKRKLRTLSPDALDSYSAKQKFFATFYRKGYSLELIKKVYEELDITL